MGPGRLPRRRRASRTSARRRTTRASSSRSACCRARAMLRGRSGRGQTAVERRDQVRSFPRAVPSAGPADECFRRWRGPGRAIGRRREVLLDPGTGESPAAWSSGADFRGRAVRNLERAGVRRSRRDAARPAMKTESRLLVATRSSLRAISGGRGQARRPPCRAGDGLRAGDPAGRGRPASGAARRGAKRGPQVGKDSPSPVEWPSARAWEWKAKTVIRVGEKWWTGGELNSRHRDFQSRALPTELPVHRAA